jgi:hypothetical protein
MTSRMVARMRALYEESKRRAKRFQEAARAAARRDAKEKRTLLSPEEEQEMAEICEMASKLPVRKTEWLGPLANSRRAYREATGRNKPYRRSFAEIMKEEDKLWYRVWYERCVRSGDDSKEFKEKLKQYRAKYGKVYLSVNSEERRYDKGFLACLRWVVGMIDELDFT